MKVVLDSNVFIADFRLNKTSFKVLFEAIKKGDVQVFVPELVVDEVVNKYKQRIEGAKRVIDSELKPLKKLTEVDIESPIEKKMIESSLREYEKFLKEQFEEFEIQIIDYPKTTHKYFAKKAMLKKKPFNTNEKGYRDAIIWENIKSMLSDYDMVSVLPEVVFITKNHNDFADVEGNLHSDLVSELVAEDFHADSVVLNHDLVQFNKDRITISLQQAHSFKKKIKEDSDFTMELRTEINSYLYKSFVGSDLTDYDKDGISDDYDYTVNGFYDESYSIEIDKVSKLNTSNYLVDLSFQITCMVDFFMDKYSVLSSDDESISIQDADWNRHVMWVSKEIDVSVEMSLIIKDDLEVTSLEINDTKILS